MFVIPAKILATIALKTVSTIAKSSGISLFEKATGEKPDTKLLAAACEQLNKTLAKGYDKALSLQPKGMNYNNNDNDNKRTPRSRS